MYVQNHDLFVKKTIDIYVVTIDLSLIFKKKIILWEFQEIINLNRHSPSNFILRKEYIFLRINIIEGNNTLTLSLGRTRSVRSNVFAMPTSDSLDPERAGHSNTVYRTSWFLLSSWSTSSRTR